MEAKHTPGPWVVGVSHDGKQFMIVGDDGEAEVAIVMPHRPLQRMTMPVMLASNDEKANARLIAAAPELLAALQNLMNGIDTGAITSDHDETFANAISRAKKALSLVRGEAA
jgi:hypothetical protein